MSISGLSEAALGEGSGAKLHKLSVKQIKSVSDMLGLELTSPYFLVQLFGMGAKKDDTRQNGRQQRPDE